MELFRKRSKFPKLLLRYKIGKERTGHLGFVTLTEKIAKYIRLWFHKHQYIANIGLKELFSLEYLKALKV